MQDFAVQIRKSPVKQARHAHMPEDTIGLIIGWTPPWSSAMRAFANLHHETSVQAVNLFGIPTQRPNL
ncbi:MAG TPA: hypothetical protein DEF45_25795 [Rhodopirellula sp.]|nr:hypothetical protein [Rhodopirellula sp.]